MKKSVAAAVIGLAVGLGFAMRTQADERAWAWSPLGVGIAAPVQLPFTSTDIYGLRLGGLFGYNRNVYGLDVGLAEIASGDFIGLQAAGFTWTESNAYGVQFGALANVVRGRMVALQAGFANTVWDDAGGVQLACINYATDFTGLQIGGILNWNELDSYGLELSLVNANQSEYYGWAFGALVNYTDKFTGFSCGFLNVAYDMEGLQLGVLNACDHMHGVQIGLINMICESKLPIMPVLNAWF